MGSKGSQTVNTNQSQTYTPAPQAGNAISAALQQGQNVAQTPFSTPVAPVAGFSPQQQQAFNITGQTQGYAQPFINQANQYFSPQGTQQFLNPYTQNVTANLQDIFGQQMQQTTGQLQQAAGGVGADRIAVGQSNLAKQQGLAAGQTYANLYNNAAQLAQTAGFGTANLGTAGQNAQLQGAQALLGTGGLQQQLQQAQLNAPYQNILQQIAWPYQNAQFNASITGALAPGLGGTTQGTGATTYPPQSPWGTIAGLGLAGAGIYGIGNQQGWWSGGGGSGGGNLDANGMPLAARGGRINPYAPGGAVDDSDSLSLPQMSGSAIDPMLRMEEANQLQMAGAPHGGGGGMALPGGMNGQPINMTPQALVPQTQLNPIQPHIPQLAPPPQQQQSGGKGSGIGDVLGSVAKIAPLLAMAARGGAVRGPFDATAVTNMQSNARRDDIEHRYGPVDAPIYPGRRVVDPEGQQRDVRQLAHGGASPYFRGFAEGGDTGFDPYALGVDELKAKFAGPYSNAPNDRVDQTFDDSNRAATAGTMWPGSASTPPMLAAAPNTPLPRPQPAAPEEPTGPTAVADAGRAGDEVPATAEPTSGIADYAQTARTPARNNGMVNSPWMALLTAGLGTLAASGQRDARGLPTPPFAAIGQGGLQGIKTLQEQQTAGQKQQTIEQAARHLDLAAEAERNKYSKMTPYQREEVGIKKQELQYKKDVLQGALIDQDTLETMAESYWKAGNTGVLSNLGRGTQGAQNIARFWNTVQRQMATNGASGSDLAAAKARFAGDTAAMRTAGTRGANIDIAVAEAQRTFPLALEASRALPRTQFVPWNKAVQMVQAGTSSPELGRFVTANQGVITAYGQAMSRTGVNSVHAQQRAEGLLSEATSQEAYEAKIDQMRREMDAAQRAPDEVRKQIEARISGRQITAPLDLPGGGAPTAGAEAAPAVGTRKQFKQGWGVWNGTTYVPE